MLYFQTSRCHFLFLPPFTSSKRKSFTTQEKLPTVASNFWRDGARRSRAETQRGTAKYPCVFQPITRWKRPRFTNWPFNCTLLLGPRDWEIWAIWPDKTWRIRWFIWYIHKVGLWKQAFYVNLMVSDRHHVQKGVWRVLLQTCGFGFVSVTKICHCSMRSLAGPWSRQLLSCDQPLVFGKRICHLSYIYFFARQRVSCW